MSEYPGLLTELPVAGGNEVVDAPGKITLATKMQTTAHLTVYSG